MTADATQLIDGMARAAREAAAVLATASAERKHAALIAAAAAVREAEGAILAANAEDLVAAEAKGLAPAMLDRLTLDSSRLRGIIDGLRAIAEQPDPVGRVLAEWDRPNGLHIRRVATPIGVLGVIYESRPNVTADAGALALKSGNAVILRGGSESFHSSTALHAAMVQGLRAANLPEAAIQLVPTPDRAAVGAMLSAQGLIDVIIPRGGKGLVGRVQAEARVPVFAHLEGICHVYVDAAADLDMALEIVVNSKTHRPSVCNAAENLLVHREVAEAFLPRVLSVLSERGVVLHADERASAMAGVTTVPVTELAWNTEFHGLEMSVGVVDSLDEAVAHIDGHSTHHTDCIVTENRSAARTFVAQVDSAVVMVNASTRFTDGGEFGFGAEIGISTQKLHARGPMALAELTTTKWVVDGDGQIR